MNEGEAGDVHRITVYIRSSLRGGAGINLSKQSRENNYLVSSGISELKVYVNLWTCHEKPDQCGKDHWHNVRVFCLPSRWKRERELQRWSHSSHFLSLGPFNPVLMEWRFQVWAFINSQLSAPFLWNAPGGSKASTVTSQPIKGWRQLEWSWLRHINWSHLGNPWHCKSFITICFDLKTVYPDNGLKPADHSKVLQCPFFLIKTWKSQGRTQHC